MDTKIFVTFCVFLIISLVSCNSKTEKLNLNNELYRLVRAEGDPVTEDPGSGGSGTISNSSSYQTCERSLNCCAMYTWPGNDHLRIENYEENAPRTCEELPGIKNNKANTVACFGPLIYSNGTRRPDPTLAVEKCKADNIHCFCTGRSCLKYSYLRNDAAKSVINETKFCGTLTNIGTNKEITSGCYRETISGTSEIREVCACIPTTEGVCNTTTTLFSSFTLILFLLLCIISE